MGELLSIRNQAEIERSRSEAAKIDTQFIKPAQIHRYLNPPENTLFPLEYAFHLLEDVSDKTVLDLGCGSGENLVVLIERGAGVTGMDISPALIRVAEERLRAFDLHASVTVGDAYHTALPSESIDVIFCSALIHHLDIPLVHQEMYRILRKGGTIILKEPIRFSRLYAHLRSLFSAKEDVSQYEHPLTQAELAMMTQGFEVEKLRYFRLPFVPLISHPMTWKTSHWMIRHFPSLRHYATCLVARLRKTP